MENEENNEIEINGGRYYNLEDVPEPFRDMVKAKMEAAGTAAPYDSKITVQKDFQFQGGTGLADIIKLLIKVSQPPKPRASKLPAPASIVPETEETPEPAACNLPRPDPIEPSSSGWIIWLAVIAYAAFYWFYTSIK